MDEFEKIENYKLKKSDILRKNGAGFIDAILILIIQKIVFQYFTEIPNLIKFSNPLSFMFFYAMILFLIYRLLTIVVFGKTIGMAVLNMQFAKRNQTQLSLKEKALSALMIYTNSVDSYYLE